MTKNELSALFNLDEIEAAIDKNKAKIEELAARKDKLEKEIDELRYNQQSLYQLKGSADYLLLKSKLESNNGND